MASLPADVAKYVSRERVPRIKLSTDPRTGEGRLWIKFNKPLSKYAFSQAVADEDVDGTRNVVNILRAETRKMFGDHVHLAPTERMADGQIAPPFGRLPLDEQRRIKSQIAMAGITASMGMSVSVGAKEPKTGAAQGDATSVQDTDDVHRAERDSVAGGRLATGDGLVDGSKLVAEGKPVAGRAADDTAGRAAGNTAGDTAGDTAANIAETRDLAANDDPWAVEMASADGAYSPDNDSQFGGAVSSGWSSAVSLPSDASVNVSRDVSRDVSHGVSQSDRAAAHREGEAHAHHTKHVAVPDLSDGIDPWAEEPAATSAMPKNAQSPAQALSGDENGTAEPSAEKKSFDAQSSASWSSPSGSSVSESSLPEPSAWELAAWGPSTSASGTTDTSVSDSSVSDTSVSHTQANAGVHNNIQSRDQQTSDHSYAQNHQQASAWPVPSQHNQQPQSVAQSPSSADSHANPANSGGNKDLEDDEYSMNDVSLGSATAMSIDDLKKFFEVKKIEEFASDDPHNPKNIQSANKHDSEA